MIDQVGVRALQQHASAVVRRVAQGEVVEVTDRGRPVARIVPIASDPLADLVEAGQARRATRSIADLPRLLPASSTDSLTTLLQAARADER